MTDITKLKGIGKANADKFAENGITTVEQLFVIPPPKVAEMLGMDNDSAINLFKKARALFKDEPLFQTGLEADEEDKNIDKISTGTKSLDKLFTGGIECGATTEIYGEFGCGKTQFCHTMCVRNMMKRQMVCPLCKKDYGEEQIYKCLECELAVETKYCFKLEEVNLENKGGLDARSLYLDSEGTFEPSRIRSIASSLSLNEDECLSNIIRVKAFNSADQYMILQQIEEMLAEEENKDIKLIVMDSATGLFRQDFSGRGMLSERQKYLDEFLTLASNIANYHNVAIIWTNQVMINPGVFYGDPVTAVGGTVLAHKSTYRVYFKKSGAYRIGIMVDSPKHAKIEVAFGLSEAGVVDKEVAEEIEKERKKAKAKAKKEEKEKDESLE